MRKRINVTLSGLAFLTGGFCLSLSNASGDDLKALDVPVYRDRSGYGLGVTEYSLETTAELLEGQSPEHTLELSGLLQPPEKADVLCFSTTLLAESAENARGKDLLLPQRRRGKEQVFRALVPSEDYKSRRGDPLLLSEVSLDAIELDEAGYLVEQLTLTATAVVVKDRESEEIDAEVSGEFINVGNKMQVRVSAKEVDKKGEMTVKLNVKRSGDKRSAVIDSLYALNKRGKPIGGGRWTNELDLFAKSYEVELVFPLTGDEDSVDQLRIVLATDYDIKEVDLVVEDLFEK